MSINGDKELFDYIGYISSKILPSSNLKNHYVCYLTQLAFVSRFKRMLFDNDFTRWKLGPVLADVYFEYSLYIAEPVPFETSKTFKLTPDENAFVIQCVSNLAEKSVHELSAMCRETSLWQNTEMKHSIKAVDAMIECVKNPYIF